MTHAVKVVMAAALSALIVLLVVLVGLALGAISVGFAFLAALAVIVLACGAVVFVTKMAWRLLAAGCDAAWRALTRGCF